MSSAAELDKLLDMDLGSEWALETLIGPPQADREAESHPEEAAAEVPARGAASSALVVVPPFVEQRLLGALAPPPPPPPPQVQVDFVPTLEAVMTAMENTDVSFQAHTDVQAIANFHFASRRLLHGSKPYMARLTQVDASDIESHVTGLASVLSELDKIGRGAIGASVGGIRLPSIGILRVCPLCRDPHEGDIAPTLGPGL